MLSSCSKEVTTLSKQKVEAPTLSTAAESVPDVDKNPKSEVIAVSDNNEDNIDAKEKEVGPFFFNFFR